MSWTELAEVVALGILQGVAEFLPISSSGHLVIGGAVIREATGRTVDAESDLLLNVALHVGTLFSIVWYYRADLWELRRRSRTVVAIVVATLPLVAGGLFLKDLVERAFHSPLVAGCGLLVTASLLLTAHRLGRPARDVSEIGPGRALVVGLFQLVAIVPGISRSGSTISGGLLAGLRSDAAATFSFLIGAVAITGAAVLEGAKLWKHGMPEHGFSGASLALGAATSFVVGCSSLVVLRWFLARSRLHWFAAYCAAVGIATIAWQLRQSG